MENLTFLHNPRCSKSRQALELLTEKNINIKIREYQKDLLTKEELIEICNLLNMHPANLIRKTDDKFRELFSKKKHLDDDIALDWMLKYPSLIQRPILINNGKAKLGRPVEEILEIL